jgi:hypothetical protein
MNHTTEPQPVLGPVARMLPPDGCRGAVTAWPQLQRALASAALVAPSLLPARVGGPAQLLEALSWAPALLQSRRPPADIYGHYTWLTRQVLGAVYTVAALLRQLPPMLEAARAVPGAEPGDLARKVLVGPAGLKPVAERISVLASDFAQKLAEHEQRATRQQAMDDLRSAGARLREQAAAIAVAPSERLAALHAQSVRFADSASAGLSEIQAHAAAASADAILANMGAAVRSMASAWNAVAANFADAVSTATPDQLGDPAYLRTTLLIDEAALQWRRFGDEVQTYVEDLSTIGAC